MCRCFPRSRAAPAPRSGSARRRSRSGTSCCCGASGRGRPTWFGSRGPRCQDPPAAAARAPCAGSSRRASRSSAAGWIPRPAARRSSLAPCSRGCRTRASGRRAPCAGPPATLWTRPWPSSGGRWSRAPRCWCREGRSRSTWRSRSPNRPTSCCPRTRARTSASAQYWAGWSEFTTTSCRPFGTPAAARSPCRRSAPAASACRCTGWPRRPCARCTATSARTPRTPCESASLATKQTRCPPST
mmetsp:Transcript_42662/g.86021  ORF Transcript_42662/g.86021 Transcript_42662/m.86021 type:complete len:243 (-) Transcript_42662:165-893(-)